MTTRRASVNSCCTLRLVLLATFMVSCGFPARASGQEKGGRVDPLKAPLEAADRGMAFGYLQVTHRRLEKPRKGERGKKTILIMTLDDQSAAISGEYGKSWQSDLGVLAIHEEQAQVASVVLRLGSSPELSYASVRPRASGGVFVASNLVAGRASLTTVSWYAPDAGVHATLQLEEPIEFEVTASAAVFVGSLQFVTSDMDIVETEDAFIIKRDTKIYDPKRRVHMIQRALDSPTAATLAAELAPKAKPPWRAILEAIAAR